MSSKKLNVDVSKRHYSYYERKTELRVEALVENPRQK
jgi:hypothetical protein